MGAHTVLTSYIKSDKVIQLRGWDDGIVAVACGVYKSKVSVSLCVMPNDIIQMCIYTDYLCGASTNMALPTILCIGVAGS